MNKKTDIITILCAEFDDKYKPITRAGFWKLYHKHDDDIEDIKASKDALIIELLQRSGAIAFGKERLEKLGVKIVTFLDDGFPNRLREKLGDFCPPLLYTCGNLGILQKKFVGYVGSRSIDKDDIAWTEICLKKNLSDGFGVVTGGAKGIDSVALQYALKNGASAVVFLADNLKEKLRDPFIQQKIWDGNLLVLSHVSPFARKMRNSFVAAAMERNKYIYALSKGTAVVRSDFGKGGTWSGAIEALKHGWAQIFVWDNKNYPGNQELIKLGAMPLSCEGKRSGGARVMTHRKDNNDIQQLSLFS